VLWLLHDMRNQLSVNADAKTTKGRKLGILTGILYFAPVSVASRRNVCPFASPGCSSACLYSAGRGGFSNVQRARIAKTQRFFDDREGFIADLRKSIAALVRKSERLNFRPAVRLNGTSDIPWESIRSAATGLTLLEEFPTVQFYDYTKNVRRMRRFTAGELPGNYQLTFSRSECNEAECLEALSAGGNVAAVFRELPGTWKGFPVVDGDTSDVRFLDATGVVVGLTAKGKAKQDSSGFVC